MLVGAATVSAITSCASFAASPSDPAVTADASAESHDGSSDAGGTDTTAKDASVEADADAARAPCRGEAACRRYVFVTSDLYAGEDIGGSIGADGRCTNRAAVPGTLAVLAGRVWQAWISDDGANLAASARLTNGTMPYRLADGTLIANSWTQLTSGALLHAIDMDETGKTIGNDFVWTGTQAFGQVTLTNCTNWSINGTDNRGSVGRANAKDGTWTNSGAVSCGNGHRLYCFEQ